MKIVHKKKSDTSSLCHCPANALRGLKDARELGDGFETLVLRMRKLYRQDRIDECFEVFEYLLENHPHKLEQQPL